MNTQEWITIISQAAGALVAIVGIVTAVKQSLKTHHNNLLAALPGVMQSAGKDVATVVEDVAKLPGVGAVKAVLGTEIHNVEDALRHSQILQIAGTALHGFETTLSTLTENQKGSIIQYVGAELKKLGIDISVPEILSALSMVQNATDVFKATPVYKNTVALDQSISAMKEAAAAPAVTTPAAATA